MGIKNIKNDSNRNSLLSYFVSGKYKQFHSAERGVTGSGIVATGGSIVDYIDGADVYRAHTFTSTGTFDVTSLGTYGGTVDYLIIGGGGGTGSAPQGANREAGSGAGGFLTGPTSVTVSSYTITIGAGGAGGVSGTPNNGVDSSAFGFTAIGGGGGGYNDPAPTATGSPGGSGGGAWYSNGSAGSGFGYPGPTQQGYPGGSAGGTNNWTGGGGGGAGSAGGVHPTNPTAGAGGAGVSNVYAYGPTIPVTYASGGQGNAYPSTNNTANGTYATGDGGSGRGSGGSGIVVVRYKIANTGVFSKASGGTVSYYGGQTIHTFTSSSIFRVLNPEITSVEYLIVGGGASGHGGHYPGGAGGQVLTGSTPVSVPAGAYTITVGGGAAQSPNAANSANAGNPSVVGSIPAAGGLSPGVGPAPANAAVGSFGTGAAGSDTATAPTLENRRGGHGVQSSISGTNLYYGGGGGGAGGNGYEGSQGGRGGYGGGGGGGTGPGGPGGTPGNQDGTYGSPVPSLGDAGVTNSGGGGGGGGVGSCGSVYCGGKAGGSGIVIIAYPS